MRSQRDIINGLPEHLRPFVAVQEYDLYTPRDHAIWRFLIKQLKFQLQETAHPTYFHGLQATGIREDRIPKIEEINHALESLGWNAIAVDGFLPPAIFMEFQALKVLAIAVNIRSFEHMLYTPAPDIIHESAGHAPFLVDIDYAEFLQRFGSYGMHALSNRHDMDVYEAIRQLSIVKENADSTSVEIVDAQAELERLQAISVEPSEANLLARLHWWTVEYGLVGSTSEYSIFGAGLLSSLSESASCIDDKAVTKKSLTVDCIYESYDITKPQPQLFVTDSCRHLSQVLDEYAQHLSCQLGGTKALERAVESEVVSTTELNSGIQVSGKLASIVFNAVHEAVYMKTQGGTQLAYKNKELANHGIDYHSEGFGSPIGRLVGMERCLSDYTIDELKRHNIEIGQQVQLRFLSGVEVSGMLDGITRRDQKNLIFTFSDATVVDGQGEVLFAPEWGIYDMAVGASIASVSGGSADKFKYPLYESPSKTVTIEQTYDTSVSRQFPIYQALAELQKAKQGVDEQLLTSILEDPELDWLILFEALELCLETGTSEHASKFLAQRLSTMEADQETRLLIDSGLKRIKCAP